MDRESKLILAILGFAAGLFVLVVPAGLLASNVSGEDATYNPLKVIQQVLNTTNTTYVRTFWLCEAIVGVLVVVLLVVVVRKLKADQKHSRRGDKAATYAGRARELKELTKAGVEEKARQLGAKDGASGFFIAKTVIGEVDLYSSIEDVCVVVAGPRRGKTTSWGINRIAAATGNVIATSNKRDIVDQTRPLREGPGKQVFLFDPQGIVGGEQEFWWDPLTYVADPVQAESLVKIFADAIGTKEDSKGNFFEKRGIDLAAGLLLAAKVSNQGLEQVFRWVQNVNDDEPKELLAAAGEIAMSNVLDGIYNITFDTKSGFFAHAQNILSFMKSSDLMKWVTPQPGLPEFKPEEFVQDSGQTLYCLSQEGKGTASPIVTALTVAVTEAAVEEAKKHPLGRLPEPLLIELDEAANVCRWSELPAMYSHFGSRGICVDTILQSWSQGERVWGDTGMKALWSAANVKVYGGGVSENQFLQQVSDLIGVYYEDSVNVTSSSSGSSRSVSKNSQQRPIAPVADLQALPRGRAWVLAASCPAVLAELVPYWKRGISLNQQTT